MQLAQFGARFESEIVVESARVFGEHIEGFGRAARPVQRHHVQPATAIAIGLLGLQCHHIGEGLGNAPQRQERGDPVLPAPTAEFFESGRLGLHPALVTETVEQPSAPHAQSTIGRLEGRRPVLAVGGLAGRIGEVQELVDVEFGIVDLEDVPVRLPPDG